MKGRAHISHTRSGESTIFMFNTENTYEMPLAIVTSDIQQFQSALTFSAKLIELENSLSTDYIRDTLFADYVRNLENKHAKDIEDIRKNEIDEVSSKLSPLIKRISENEREFNEQLKQVKADHAQQIKVLMKEKAALEADATTAKSDIESSYQREIKQIRKQLAEKEAEVQALAKGDAVIREQCSAESERLIKIIEQKNASNLSAQRESYETILKLKEEALQQREARVYQKEQELQTTIQRNASSSFRGQDGEMQFEQLAESIMKWNLTNTSKIPHSCDYSSEIHGSVVFFEIKNYTDPVRTDELSKFHRDMKEHPEVAIGIFISWNTRIVGKDQTLPFSIEWINDSQCAIYIQPLKELDINATLTLIDQTIKITGIYRKQIELKGDISETAILQPRIDKARIHIDQYISEASSSMKRIINDKKRYLELIESTYSLNISSIKSQTTSITTALSILTGEYIEDTTIDPTLIAEPEPSKPKKQVKKN
jgi:hypothetical protein